MIYLYVKQHDKTGLRYFGKTIQKDPFRYYGSGKYWKNHIKEHGRQVSTIDVWGFDNLEDAQSFALEFSKINNIANSNEWANLIDETVNSDYYFVTKRIPWNKGKTKDTDPRIANIGKLVAEAQKGNKRGIGNRSRTGYHIPHSEETKKKLSVAVTLYYQKLNTQQNKGKL